MSIVIDQLEERLNLESEDDDNSSMSIDELIEEIAKISSASSESKTIFLWTLYPVLRVGTVFKANTNIKGESDFWFNLNPFGEKVARENGLLSNKISSPPPSGPIELFPGVEKGESVLFLGLTDEDYPYESIDRQYSLSTGKRTINVIVNEERKYPKWLIGEKVVIWPLDITKFEVLAMGTGSRFIDEVVANVK